MYWAPINTVVGDNAKIAKATTIKYKWILRCQLSHIFWLFVSLCCLRHHVCRYIKYHYRRTVLRTFTFVIWWGSKRVVDVNTIRWYLISSVLVAVDWCNVARATWYFWLFGTHTHTPLRGIRRVRHQNKQTTPPSIHSHTQTHKLMTKSKKSWTMTRYYACCKVCGKTHGLRRCSRCKSVCYCSEVHQQIDWRVHKIECKKFAANMAQNASKFQCWSIILK